jgi:hypothetical protein
VTALSLGFAELASQRLCYHSAAAYDYHWSPYVIAAIGISLPFRKILRMSIWGIMSPFVNRAIPFANEIKITRISSKGASSSIGGWLFRTYSSLGSLITLRLAGLVVILIFYIGIRWFSLENPTYIDIVDRYVQEKFTNYQWYVDNFLALLISGILFPFTALAAVKFASIIVRSPIGKLLPKDSLIERARRFVRR